MQYRTHENCGGTILTGGNSGSGGAHNYCDRCHAFRFFADDDDDPELPSGTDEVANRAAMDAGEDASPEA